MKEGDRFYSKLLRCELKAVEIEASFVCTLYTLSSSRLWYTSHCYGCSLLHWCQGLNLQKTILVDDLGLEIDTCLSKGLGFIIDGVACGDIFEEIHKINSTPDLDSNEKEWLINAYLDSVKLNRLYGR